jgi:hypothetical protein
LALTPRFARAIFVRFALASSATVKNINAPVFAMGAVLEAWSCFCLEYDVLP